jgi:3-hydroxyacyl-[acyl-carrier-protein] dehydratase
MTNADFYSIHTLKTVPDGTGFTAIVRLNAAHPVFSGHFPGNPILPGVCTVQIIKELLTESLGISVQMTRVAGIKYLEFVNPVIQPELVFTCSLKENGEGSYTCLAEVLAGEKKVCTFKGNFIQRLPATAD